MIDNQDKVAATIKEMEKKIEEINKLASEKIANATNDENAKKIAEIRDNTINVINEAIEKIHDTAVENEDSSSFSDLLNRVINRTSEATEYTIKKIKEVTKDKNIEKTISETSKQINDAFDKLIDNPDVKNVFSKATNATKETVNKANEYLNKEEVKQNIDKTKDVIIDIAEAGLNGLKKILNTEGSDKGVDIPVNKDKDN